MYSSISNSLIVYFLVSSSMLYADQCTGNYCFVTPGADVSLGFDCAMAWCLGNSSQLASIPDKESQMALAQFLSLSNMNLIFVNMKRYSLDQRITWFILNGLRYKGGIANQTSSDKTEYYFYAFLFKQNNEFQLFPAKPTELKGCICSFNDCSSFTSTENYIENGQCYERFDSPSLTWFEARSICVSKSGDLATFNYDAELTSNFIPPINTTWLNHSLSYWIGVRWKNVNWKTPADNISETVYTHWSNGKPNNSNAECVCLDRNADPAWSWTDCDCNVKRQFVCAQSMVKNYSASPVTETNKCSYDKSEVVMVGLILGIGVILPLVVTIVILVVLIAQLKRQARTMSDLSESPRSDAVVTAEQQPYSSLSKIQTTDQYANYRQLSEDSKSATVKPTAEQDQHFYDQLQPNQRDTLDLRKIHKINNNYS